MLDGAWADACPPATPGIPRTSGRPGASRDAGPLRACFVLSGRIAAGARIASVGDLLQFDAAGPVPRAIGPVLLLEVAIRCTPARRDTGAGPFPSNPA